MIRFSLLDYLAYELGLMYISDLRIPVKVRKEKFHYIMRNKISLQDFENREWTDAAEYIIGGKYTDKSAAYQALLTYLSE